MSGFRQGVMHRGRRVRFFRDGNRPAVRAPAAAARSGRLLGPAHFADLRTGQGLSQADLANVIGDDHTLLPDGPAPDTGEPFYVWSCWPTPPPGFDAMAKMASMWWLEDEEGLKQWWLCPKGAKPERTGTHLALDAEPPWATK